MLRKTIRSGSHLRFYSSTVDDQEIAHFKTFVDFWWNENGAIKPLHSLNKLRIPWIRESLLADRAIKNHSLPLTGYSILDVGCGGGILSEPLARIGADVTGLDANEALINSAKLHASTHNMKLNYVVSSIEMHAQEACEKYDAVVASEVIEHVTNKQEFIEACVKCLKPNGKIFLTTFHKTWLANLCGIIIGENLINAVPKGTHQFEKFIESHELQRLLEDCNCRTEMINDLVYNILTNSWHWCSIASISYGLRAVKLPN